MGLSQMPYELVLLFRRVPWTKVSLFYYPSARKTGAIVI